MILEDIWQGATDLAGGTLRGIDQLGMATAAGRSIEAHKQRKRAISLKEQFDIIKGNFRPEVKEQAARKIIEMTQGTKIGQMMGQVYQPTGQDLATPEQRTQKYIDPYGRGQRGQYTPVDQITDLGKIQAARDKFTTVDSKGKQIPGMSEETTRAFATAERFVNKRPVAGEPEQDLSRETAIGRGFGLGPEFTDNRGLFTGPDIVSPKGTKHSFEPGAEETGTEPEISEYFQVPTEAVPVENIPKTHKQLGLANKQAEETFEQLRAFAEKNVENFNIEQSYLDNQEHYEKLMLAWREGVPDGKGGTRKLTSKEIIEILRSMGQ